MSDTFHGRSRESLIEEIRELRAALVGSDNLLHAALHEYAEELCDDDAVVKWAHWAADKGGYLFAFSDQFEANKKALEPKP